MGKKLTKAQKAALELLAGAWTDDHESQQPGWSLTWLTYGSGVHHRTLESLVQYEFITIEGAKVYITETGAAAIGRVDLFDAGNAPVQAVSVSDFDPGDQVVVRADADCDIPFDGDKLAALRDNRIVGTVVSIRELPFGNPIAVQFPGEKFSFQPHELDLWKPEPGSDAPAYRPYDRNNETVFEQLVREGIEQQSRFSREDLDNWTVLRRGGSRAGAGRKNESHKRIRSQILNEKLGYVHPIDGVYPHDRPELTAIYKDDYEGEDENGIGWSRVWLVNRFANRSKPGMSYSASLMRARWILSSGQPEWGGLLHAACEDHIMRGDEYQKIADWIDWQDNPDNPENRDASHK